MAGRDSGPSLQVARQVLGPVRATILIVSSMLGAGVFILPKILSKFGPIGIVALIGAGLGALALAVSFGALASRMGSAAEPYGIAKEAFGRQIGFWTAWMYWLSAWAGTTAIAAVWVGYVDFLTPDDLPAGWLLAAAAFALWMPVLINGAGAQALARVQTFALLLACGPIAVLIVIGPFSITREFLGPLNVSGSPAPFAVAAALPAAVFVYIGVETVAVLAERVRDPRRNVMRASVIGVLICIFIYVAATTVVMGTVPGEERRSGLASYSLSFSYLFGSPLAGQVMAATAITAGFGGLVGWALLSAELPKCAAQDGMFPPVFARVTKRTVPMTGIIISQAIATAVVVPILLGGDDGKEVLEVALSVAGVAAGTVFAVTVLADIKGIRESAAPASPARKAGVIVALGFSLFVVASATIETLGSVQSILVLLLWLAVGAATLRWLNVAHARTESFAGDSRLDPSAQP